MPDSPAPTASSRRSALAIAACTALLGLIWRLVLVRVYFGHEEEDWGNLQMARGVLDSGFRWIELEHMPGYLWMVAAVTAVVDDVELASRLVAVGMGTVTVALVAWIGARWYGPLVGWLAGLLVAFQPEAALYSATALRESSFTALLLLGVLLCGGRRFVLGGLVLAAGFLIRFNVAFSILPALVIAALWMAKKDPIRGLRGPRGAWIAAALVSATTLAWAVFYKQHPEGGTWAFWGGVMSRNTGSAVGDLTTQEHLMAVVHAVGGLLFRVFPSHVGPAALLCAPLGVLAAWRALRSCADSPDREAVLRRAWLALCGLGTFGLLMTTALFSTYEWFHNLYWKWITPLVSFLALLGVEGARQLLAWLPAPARRLRGALALVLMGTTLTVFAFQTRHQVQTSARMYGAQVLLARWIEDAWVPDVGVLGDGIPAWYLHREPTDIVTVPWTDDAVPSGDPEALGRWLNENRMGVVIHFRDAWFEATTKAPFLGRPETVDLGVVVLKPVAWSWEYGMLAYAVEQAHDVPPPTSHPPAGTWFPSPEWTP